MKRNFVLFAVSLTCHVTTLKAIFNIHLTCSLQLLQSLLALQLISKRSRRQALFLFVGDEYFKCIWMERKLKRETRLCLWLFWCFFLFGEISHRQRSTTSAEKASRALKLSHQIVDSFHFATLISGWIFSEHEEQEVSSVSVILYHYITDNKNEKKKFDDDDGFRLRFNC
jgi:hypothetical protein